MTLRFAGSVLLALVCSDVVRGAEDATLVYVGTTGDASPGIHLFRLQPQGTEVTQNVTLVPLGLAVETKNPSFFELDLERRLLFAVNELDEFEGKPGGAVSAFAIEKATGKLRLLSQRATLGRGPAHLALAGRHLLVANGGGSGVAVLPVALDGSLGEATAIALPLGAGPARCVAVDPAQRF